MVDNNRPQTDTGRPQINRQQANDILAQANRGDASVIPVVQDLLDSNPQLWKQARSLAGMVQDQWIARVTGNNLARREVIRRQMTAMLADILGPNPSPLESLLGERIAANWLEANYADLRAACTNDDSPRVALVLSQRQERAQKRFLDAVKMLANVRKLTAPVVRAAKAATDKAKKSAKSPAKMPKGQAKPAKVDDAALASTTKPVAVPYAAAGHGPRNRLNGVLGYSSQR